jgi:hypothetical protein
MVYDHTTNIGDAIQTVAMTRLLGGPCLGIYRDLPLPDTHHEVPFVVNGWFGHRPPADAANCIFAGVHLGSAEQEHIQWFRQSAKTVGARDSYTKGLLSCHRVEAELVGCPTLTFPRYLGPRTGRYTIDVEPLPGTQFESSLIPNLSWADQWKLALARLDQLRKAEIVYSGRIHVILPCLAFGTPVVFPSSAFRDLFDKSRLTLLHDLGFVYDEPVEMDVSSFAERFIAFLERSLDTPIVPVDEPGMPIPIMPLPEKTAAEAPLPAGEKPWRSWDIPRPRARKAPSVTALVTTRDGAKRLPGCLESIQRADFARRVIVCVDEATADDSVSVALRYTRDVHLVESEIALSQLKSLSPDDFVLRVNDDEQLGGSWDRTSFELLAEFNGITHFWVPRRWVMPPGDVFIAEPSCFPDFQLSLFRNDPRIVTCPSELHRQIRVEGPSLILYDSWIEHHELIQRSRPEREAKYVQRHNLEPDADLSHYLYEDQSFALAPLSASAALAARIGGLTAPRSRHFVAYRPGKEIDFRSGGDALHYMVAGWREPYPWGTWTGAGDAEVCLILEEPMRGGATLIAQVLPRIRPDDRSSRVEVLYGGELLDVWSFEEARPTERQAHVPARLLSLDQTPSFIFRTLNPTPDDYVPVLSFMRLRLQEGLL